MQRLFLTLAVVVLGCLAIPANLHALDAADYNERGNAFRDKGDYDMAIASYSQALAIEPNHPEVYAIYDNRGVAWLHKGEYDKAIADYNQALAINPNYADFYYNRGITRRHKGEYDKAIADYNQALALNPNLADAYGNLGWLQATCPDKKYRDGKKAFENANKGYQLDGGKDWLDVDILAAAYAECGDFEKAKEWEAKAIAMAATDTSSKDTDKAEAKARLELYQQGKPYREELKK